MKPLHWLVLYFSVLLVCSCAPTTSQTDQATRATEPTHLPAKTVADLPCADVGGSATDGIYYTGQSLYPAGSVFPSGEGLACLDAVADWMGSTPVTNWSLTVTGEDGFDFDAMKLAEKRLELLQRYFQRKGMTTDNWLWQTAPREETQLLIKGLP